ncbi:MAG: glycosyltransferase family 39 protein, partial [Anaerolineae bacterium]|nr:glycosyltransferase family 39 protein [Anaerolineae bacterium]
MQEVQHLPELTMPERRSIARSDALVGLLLVFVILIGGYFRFVGLNWDDFTHLHPDERFLTDVVQGLGEQLNPSGNPDAREAQIAMCIQRYPDTAGMGTFFDAMCSTLNPLNANSAHGLYVYGTLPLFIVKNVAEIVVSGSEWIAHNILANSDPSYLSYSGNQWATYDGVHLIWRFLSALSEMGIIVICFVIGAKLHDKWIGLLAAFLYAVTVFSIQMAHFGTVDAIGNLFSALAILFAVQVQREGRISHYALFGFFFGCAVASRINLVPLAAMIAVAGFLQMVPALESRLAPGERSHAILYHFGGLALAAVISVICFRIFNPYAFTGPGFFGLSLDQRWLDNMGTAQALNNGTIDSPPNFQWVNRLPYLFPLNNRVVWGMGLPLGVMAWLSWLWAGYRIVRGKPGAIMNMILFAWVLLYFGWLGRNWVTSMRYFLPAYPALVVLAAWGLVS